PQAELPAGPLAPSGERGHECPRQCGSRSRRIWVSPESSRVPISWSPMNVRPDVGTSSPAMQSGHAVRPCSPAMQCINVDLPDPEGPITAVNWPRANSTLIPFRARPSEEHTSELQSLTNLVCRLL